MPIGDLLAQINGEISKPSTTTTSASVAPLKRKADSDLQGRTDKVSRNDSSAPATPRVATPVQKLSSVTAASISKSSRPHTSLSSASKTSISKPSSVTPNTETSKVNAAKVPKKGSFAEIMARAKAAQTTMTQIGKIQHKRIEKAPSKREREEMKSAKRDANGKTKSKGPTPPLRDGRNGARENGRGSRTASIEAEKKPKKAATATTGYAGTARPNPVTAKPRPQSYGSADRDRDRRSPGPSRPRYTYAASEEDEEEDYESDVSSDMEAAVFEVDEEEERAARLARKEDALALAEENRLKKEKEEKRRKLAAMAKTRR